MTPRVHPLSLIQANVGIHGVQLLHLGRKEPVLRDRLREILTDVAEGKLRPILDRSFTLNRPGAVQAHSYLHARRNLGKVVLTP